MHSALGNQPVLGRLSLHLDPGPRSHPDSAALLAPPDKRKFPNIKYWRRQDWNSRTTTTTEVNNQVGIRGKSRIAAGINVKFSFVENEDGTPVDGFRISGITNQMREIWRECHSQGIVPVTWGKGTSSFKTFFRLQMYGYAPELRLCEDNWKLEQIATVNYSGWYQKNILGEENMKSEDEDDIGDAKTIEKNDEYMHLPQKRLSAGLPASVKKKKKLKVPIDIPLQDASKTSKEPPASENPSEKPPATPENPSVPDGQETDGMYELLIQTN